MRFEIKSKTEFQNTIRIIFKEEYKWNNNTIEDCVLEICTFLNDLRNDIQIGIDYPYVDKMYRNSFYHYYSSKLDGYSRNCIRLSFFSDELNIEDFYDSQKHENISTRFLGFLVLRPTPKNLIGRNVLRPDLLNKNEAYYTTWSNGYASIYGLKLKIKGFPHCSQDSEMMVCAETTIWSVVEYFSHKYPEYSHVLPSDINKILASTSSERQVPSDGLTALQISYVLKKLGFGVKVYTVSRDGDDEKDNIDQKQKELEKIKRIIIPIYVESGIPVLTTVGNSTDEGHVFNIVGRTEYKSTSFAEIKKLENGSVLYDFYEQPTEYLVIDDNLTPYSRINLDNPTKNHINYEAFIEGVIVPLHSKIYMEADKVHPLAFSWIVGMSSEIDDIPSLVLKTYLTSSRSYKNYILKNNEIPISVKNIILTMNVPKFLWITELSTVEQVAEHLASGIILIDATEPKSFNVLATFINNYYVEPVDGKFKPYSLPLPPFETFNNLKQF